MKKILVLLLTLVIVNCSSVIDDSNLECVDDCTNVKGKIVSSEDLKGIPNVEVLFSYREGKLFSADTRIIARGFTDKNGNFSIKGYLEENELNYNYKGSFIININDDSLSDEFIKTEESVVQNQGVYPTLLVHNELNLNHISKRDTLINYNLVLPKKEIIKLNIKNFKPLVNFDGLTVNNRVLSGIPESVSNTQTGFKITKEFKEENFQLNLIGGKNLLNKIIIEKEKNGVLSKEIIDINLTNNQILDVDY